MLRRATLLLLSSLVLPACSNDDPPDVRTADAQSKPRTEPETARLPAPHRSAKVAGEPVVVDTEIPTESESIEESLFDSDAWNSSVGLGGGRAGRFWRAPGTETYEAILEHGFRTSVEHPLSTFAIDVDGASWTNVRRFLNEGRLPPKDAVRVEECVNWFRYADAQPPRDAPHPIAVRVESGPCPWQPEHRLLRIVLRTRDVDLDALPPRNLVFLIDVSGSMRDAAKLPLLRRGLRLLARQLRPQDRVGIVTYAGNSRVALEPTPGSERSKIEAAIESLEAGGGTNGAAGIQSVYDLARTHRDNESIDRVILATDGDFNVGIADRDQLVRLIEHEREDGIFLSVLGFGTGNLKDATLETLGRHGNGHYAYVDSIDEARRVLVEQAGATLVTVAKDVKVQIEFNPRFVVSYRQVGYENRALKARDFNDDTKDAGEMGAGHTVTALYEIVPVGVASPVPPVDDLRYQLTRTPAGELPDDAAARSEIATIKLRYKHPDADTSERVEVFVENGAPDATSDDFRFASAVAAFALILRGSPHSGNFGIDETLALAQTARGADAHGERAEFIKLCRMAGDLAATERGSR